MMEGECVGVGGIVWDGEGWSGMEGYAVGWSVMEGGGV